MMHDRNGEMTEITVTFEYTKKEVVDITRKLILSSLRTKIYFILITILIISSQFRCQNGEQLVHCLG